MRTNSTFYYHNNDIKKKILVQVDDIGFFPLGLLIVFDIMYK